MSMLDKLEVGIAVGGFFLMILICVFLTYVFFIILTSPEAHGQEINDIEGMEDVEFCSGHLSWLDREFCEQLSAPQPP